MEGKYQLGSQDILVSTRLQSGKPDPVTKAEAVKYLRCKPQDSLKSISNDIKYPVLYEYFDPVKLPDDKGMVFYLDFELEYHNETRDRDIVMEEYDEYFEKEVDGIQKFIKKLNFDTAVLVLDGSRYSTDKEGQRYFKYSKHLHFPHIILKNNVQCQKLACLIQSYLCIHNYKFEVDGNVYVNTGMKWRTPLSYKDYGVYQKINGKTTLTGYKVDKESKLTHCCLSTVEKIYPKKHYFILQDLPKDIDYTELEKAFEFLQRQVKERDDIYTNLTKSKIFSKKERQYYLQEAYKLYEGKIASRLGEKPKKDKGNKEQNELPPPEEMVLPSIKTLKRWFINKYQNLDDVDFNTRRYMGCFLYNYYYKEGCEEEVYNALFEMCNCGKEKHHNTPREFLIEKPENSLLTLDLDIIEKMFGYRLRRPRTVYDNFYWAVYNKILGKKSAQMIPCEDIFGYPKPGFEDEWPFPMKNLHGLVEIEDSGSDLIEATHMKLQTYLEDKDVNDLWTIKKAMIPLIKIFKILAGREAYIMQRDQLGYISWKHVTMEEFKSMMKNKPVNICYFFEDMKITYEGSGKKKEKVETPILKSKKRKTNLYDIFRDFIHLFEYSWIHVKPINYDVVNQPVYNNGELNLFQGFRAKKKAFDMENIQPILNHIKYLCSNNQAYADDFVNYLANLLQKPRKIGLCYVFQSEQGTGKNAFFDWFINEIIGIYAIMIDDFSKVTDFNFLLENKIFTVLNECVNAQDYHKENNQFKAKITDVRLLVNEKHKNQRIMECHNNFVMMTQSIYPFVMEGSDRRFILQNPDSAIKQDKEYFNFLFDHLYKKDVPHQFYSYLLSLDTYTPRHYKTEQYQKLKIAVREEVYNFIEELMDHIQTCPNEERDTHIADGKTCSCDEEYRLEYHQTKEGILIKKQDLMKNTIKYYANAGKTSKRSTIQLHYNNFSHDRFMIQEKRTRLPDENNPKVCMLIKEK